MSAGYRQARLHTIELAAGILHKARPSVDDSAGNLTAFRDALIGSPRMMNVFRGSDGELSIMEDENSGAGCAHLAALDIESFCEALADKDASPPESVDALFLHLEVVLDWIKRVVWDPAAARLLSSPAPLTADDWAKFSAGVHDTEWQTLKLQMIWPPPPAKSSATPVVKRHRRELVKSFCEQHGISDMHALARRLAISRDSIYGMINGDGSRYSEETLQSTLGKLNLSSAVWNGASASAQRVK